jgi:osmotically-inducible protein OsmY
LHAPDCLAKVRLGTEGRTSARPAKVLTMANTRTMLGTLAALLTLCGASVAHADRDAVIAGKVIRTLVASGTVDVDALSVVVVNGEAELRGTARSAYARDAAGRAAGAVAGVTAVRNVLTVRNARADRDADDVIADRVRAAMLAAGIDNAKRIGIHSFNGAIELSGTVDSDETSQIASRVAGETRGVTSVRNALVTPGN